MGRSIIGDIRTGRIVAALPPRGVAEERCLGTGNGRAGVAKPGEEDSASGPWEFNRFRKIELVLDDIAAARWDYSFVFSCALEAC